MIGKVLTTAMNKDSKRPLTVCFPFVGDEVGGSHISALKLIANLDVKRVRATIALHQDGDVLCSHLRSLGLDYVVLPKAQLIAPQARRGSNSLGLLTYITQTMPLLRSFLVRQGVDIVHTNDGQIHATWALSARLAGAKLLWHHRADPEAKGVNFLAPLLANHLVSVSRFSKPVRPVLPIDTRFSVVHSPFEHPENPPDRQLCRAELVRELNCSADSRFVGYFGGLIQRKRPVAFVNIVAEMHRTHPAINLHGVLFGEAQRGGPALDVDVKMRARELGIEDRIHLMGFRQPIDGYMSAVDVMLVPALSEPFGRTLIESMMLGTPVIATRHGGNIEAIDHETNGFLVSPDGPAGFISPLHRLLTDPQHWDSVSKTAKAHALARFSVDSHVQSIMEIYDRMIPR